MDKYLSARKNNVVKAALIIFCSLIMLISYSAKAESDKLVILTTFSKASLTPLVEEFNQRFPETKVHLLYRRTSSIRYLLDRPLIQDVDLVLSSSPFLMKGLSERKHLDQLPEKLQTPTWLKPYTLVDNAEVTTFAYSGGGLIINSDYLKNHNLSQPTSWRDLTKPEYFGHLSASTPARSGTNQLMLESLLQKYGWNEGWKLIMNMAANLTTISSRSFGVSDGVAKGHSAVGPVIDSYAVRLKTRLSHISFVSLSDFTLMPSYVGIINTSKNHSSAEIFIRFLLSQPVQEGLIQKTLAKHSMRDSELALSPHTTLSTDSTFNRELAIQVLFDLSITRRLPDLCETWLSIISAEREYSHSPSHLEQIQKAKNIAFTMPVSQSTALTALSNDGHYSNLTQLERDPERLEVLKLWQGKLAINLKKANELIDSLPYMKGINDGK